MILRELHYPAIEKKSYFSYTEAVAPKQKPKPAILAKGTRGACFYTQRNTNLTIQAACTSHKCFFFFLTEQEGTARNASLVKERVKIVPMKKGNLLLFYVT